jgi:hypothetical protein
VRRGFFSQAPRRGYVPPSGRAAANRRSAAARNIHRSDHSRRPIRQTKTAIVHLNTILTTPEVQAIGYRCCNPDLSAPGFFM